MFKKDFCLNLLSKISYQKHLVLSIFFFFTFVLITLLFDLKFNNGIYNYINKNGATWKNFLVTEKNFSSTSDVKVIIENKNGILNLETLKVLSQLQNEILNVDYKILELKISKFYNDTYLNYLSYYFLDTINKTLKSPKSAINKQSTFLSSLYNSKNLYNSISQNSEFFKISEAENIVTIFKHNEKYILNIFNEYSGYFDKNNTVFTVESVSSFANQMLPVYNLKNYDKFFNKLLSLGMKKSLIHIFINYVLEAKIYEFDDISIPFLKFIGFDKVENIFIEVNKKNINIILAEIQNNKTFTKIKKLIDSFDNLDNEKLEWIKLRILKNNSLNKVYFSNDLDKTFLKVFPVPSLNRKLFYSSYSVINKIVEHYRWKYPNLIFTEIGDPVLSFWSGIDIVSDSKIIIIFFIMVVFLIVAILLQQIPVLIFYLVSTVSSIAWTFGVMSIFNVEFSFLSSLLIPYALALNVIFTVFFYEFFLRNKNIFDFVCKSPLKPIFIVLFSLLASSFFTKSSALFNFMFFLFFVTLISLFINMVILPAYIRMTGFVSKITLDKPNFVNELIYVFNKNQISTFFLIASFIIIFLPGLRNLKVSLETYNTLEKTNFVRNTYEEFNSNFYGAETLTVSVYSKGDSVDQEDKLALMQLLNKKLFDTNNIGSFSSIIDLDINNLDMYPKSTIKNFIDNSENYRATATVKSSQIGFFRTIKKYIINVLKKEAPYTYSKVNLVFSGEYSLKYNIVVDTVRNLYFVLFLTSILIFLLLCYSSGSLINSLKIILPSVTSLFIVYGVMGYLGLTLDFGSIIAGFFTFIFGVIASCCLKNLYDYFKISICIFICITFPFLTLLIASYQALAKFGLIMFFTMLISTTISFLILPTTSNK